MFQAHLILTEMWNWERYTVCVNCRQDAVRHTSAETLRHYWDALWRQVWFSS